MKGFIVVSGLPGSGKSTLGRQVAASLGCPFLDKDVFLESLFDGLGTGDTLWRGRLSRAADGILRIAASSVPAAVLVSWWRHPKAEGASGTDVEWLRQLPGPNVELHCLCSPSIACDRFFARQRHAGHLDADRSVEGELASFRAAACLGPLGVGPVVPCDTAGSPDLAAITEALRRHAAWA